MSLKKRASKSIAIALAGITLATPVLGTVHASGLSPSANNTEFTQELTQEFISASDDTIIAYMEGVPIRKSEVDENGVVKSEKITEIENINSKNLRATVSHTRTIPKGYNNATIKTQITAPQYTQTNIQYYFTHLNGAKFASGVEMSSNATIMATIAGYIPIIGNAISLPFNLASLYKSSIAGKIRSYTNNGRKVKITEAKSKYGTFYGVFAWNNRVIETHKSYDGSTKEKILNLQYKK